MDFEMKGLKRAEAATLKLRSLYETYGYRKYRMGRFEEYGLYAANRSFLPSEHILTFTDLDGRLMALKPDITLGIAKNTKAGRDFCEKVYYIESVYRESKESHTYKEISQMGLECMGGVDSFVITEVVGLAVQTLAAFGQDYVLKLSGMDFVAGLLEELGVGRRAKRQLLEALRAKNRSGLALLSLYGDFRTVIAQAGTIADSPAMKEALERLSLVCEALKADGLGERIRLDFTMIQDMEYYNGIIFQGYLDGLARHVLSGGQYDGMMAKLKKPESAIGFALYLDEFNWLPERRAEYDLEALVLYDGTADPALLGRAVKELRGKGLRVRVERAVPGELRFGQIFRFRDGALQAEDGKGARTC